MGYITKVECKNCGFKKRLRLGFGFLSKIDEAIDSDDKETINECRKSFSREDRGQILAAMSDGKAELSTYYSLYKCRKCGNYHSQWCMTIRIKGSEQKYESDEPFCELCNGAMQNMGVLSDLELKVELDKCPLCGHGNEIHGDGLWD